MADKKYVGKGKEKKFDNGGTIVNFSIHVPDLPTPNEKGYVNLTLAGMRQTDQYGNTHTIYINDFQPKGKASGEEEKGDLPF
jgi:hypothetical protein